ncbi:MAG: DNA mismatch repair endonuclease MutL [Lacrimispora saccharolytica]
MQKIEVLDQTTIDKIAAGEVVERPASVVKELVENALDANATAITVEIKDGGISLIRITDNGSGIPADQVRTAFLRHATSKLRTVEELTGIASLGFRGEALSSIAAVAQIEMITKVPDVLQGVRYLIEGGKEKLFEEIGAPEGTTFIVKNLFYNTPARKKFLRTPTSEANAVGTVVEQLALSHPEVSFKYMVNHQTKLHTSGNRNIRELVYNIYGRDIARELIEIQGESELMKISGFIGKPVVSRGNRNFENYYVNHRYVKSKLLAKAIEDGYHTAMMQHKYPFTLLYLEMDGAAVDVNVHPTKMELRFSRQEEIYHQLLETISRTLAGEEQVVQVSFGNQEKKKEHPQKESPSVPEPFEHRRMQQVSGRPSAFGSESRRMPIYPPVRNAAPQAVAEKNSYLTREESALFDLPGKPGSGENVSEEKKSVDPEASVGAVPNLQAELQKGIDSGTESAAESKQQDSVVSEPLTESQQETRAVSGAAVKPQEEISKDPEQKPEQLQLFQDPLLSEQARRHHKIIGQVFDTFWLVQYQDNLYIIDQHAAHEKVLFERMMKNYKEKNVLSQMVSPPLIVTLTAQEAELLEKYEDIFTGFGYEISPFGGREYAINAVPHNLYGIASQDLFVEVLDHLEEVGEKPLDIITEKLASMSCKAAVKGNHALSFQEVERLIDELLTLEDPYHCPHGRPTIISISRQEMEKKFKRIV